ncbi:MAG: methylmalonyl-CoA mutase family protein [Anaerolineaceae bacterium]|nr:methylmalonyl-CoA mutase family protein [Anaerolineaceae bacterium]
MTLREEKKRWKSDVLDPAISRFRERQEEFETLSGIPVEQIYLPSERDYLSEEGFPGEYPFTRGIQPTMYRGRFWTMRQYAGYASAEESNARYRYLLSQGQTGLSVAFDLPTQIGYDADDPIAIGEVGKVGVSISTIEDMAQLFHEIPLDKVSTSMTINAPAGILLAMYIAVAKQQGVEIGKIRGTIQNDILKEYIARGTYIFPPKPSMRLITDIFAYGSKNLPLWNTISISGYHIREAGSTAVQELAFTLANAIAYVESALKAGLEVDGFASQLSFFFNSHNNFLEEIAKFRAGRRLWARIMRERFDAKLDRSCRLRFHTQTAGSTLTAQQPENNIVRVTLQALSAVLGGTQSLHTNSMDEALWLPTEKSVRTALRTQQIIALESGVADTVDPLAGSYYIEYLTDEICNRTMEYIERIDQLGGALAAIETGYIQNEIQDAAYQYQKSVEDGSSLIVGLNTFKVEEDIELERLKVDTAIEEGQKKKLKEFRKKRNNQRVVELKTKLEAAAKGDQNMMPLLITCVEDHLTLGEICSVLRDVWGEYSASQFG